MQARNAEGSRHRFYGDIPQWQEIFDNPTGHPQQENKMPINQISSEINLTADQLQSQQEEQYLQSLSSCAYLPSSQLPLTMQNHTSFPNQLPVYPETKQLHDQHLQQGLQQNNLPGIQPYDFPPISQCPSTIQYQSYLQRNIMSRIPIEPQLESNQDSFSVPKRPLSSADTVAASPSAKNQYQEHIQRHPNHQQLRHQAPPQTAPLIRPRSSNRRNPQRSCREEDSEISSLKVNFVYRFYNAHREEKTKLKEMAKLINSLKESRIQLNLSEADFSLEMSKQMEAPITRCDIRMLEEFTMDLGSMWTFKPLIERWLETKERLGKEQPRIPSESSVNAENFFDLPGETQATGSTTNARVLEDDIQQKKEHGTEDIVFLGKWLATDKENVTSLSENCFQKEKNLIHNPNVSSMPHYPSFPTPASSLDVYQLHHDRPSQPSPTDFQHTSFPSGND